MTLAEISLQEATVAAPRRPADVVARREFAGAQVIAKRVLDVAGSSLLLVVSAPLVLAAMLAVREIAADRSP